MAQGPHISLAAEQIGSIAGLPITNSTLMTWMTMAVLTLFAYFATRNIKKIPSNIQSIAEMIVEGIYTLFTSVVGAKYIDKFFPLLATIFLFVALANWLGLLPGVGTIGLTESPTRVEETHEAAPPAREAVEEQVVVDDHGVPVVADTHEAASVAEGTAVETHESGATEEHTTFIPLFRGATADLNTTLALAIISVFAIQYYGVATLGAAYFKKFFNFSDPIMFGVGILEIVSEFSRIISFAFRLFGNIFAGEVLLTVIAFLMPLLAPLPFLGLELFVGFIQALVFSMLTAVFLNMATVSHDSH